MTIERPRPRQERPKNAKLVFQGIIFNVYHWKQKLFDGSFATFEQLSRNDAVFVIPVSSDGQIIITKQNQPGRKSYYAFPGGHMDSGETPFEAAKRELLEETGYAAKKWKLLEASQPTSKADWAVYYFVAYGCEKQHEPKSDAGERIQVKLLNFSQLLKTCLSKNFAEREFKVRVYEALLSKQKMKTLKNILSPR